MGAPKLKWTPEEEAALKAGIAKYGLGKWSTILKDPEFSDVLKSRSNVDLKDKWRNISVMANGWGSRQRIRNVIRSTPLPPMPVHSSTDQRVVGEEFPEAPDARSLAVYPERRELAVSRKPITRFDDLVVEAVSKLKEPRGSSRASIAWYIEEQYSTPLDFERLLTASLKLLTENGRLIKVRHQYRIAPRSASFDPGESIAPLLLLEGGHNVFSSVATDGIEILNKADIDADLDKLKNMTALEAAEVAAKAVAEAEAAVAEAEAAAREAEEAEAEAEAAQCFAEAAKNALYCRPVYAWYSQPFRFLIICITFTYDAHILVSGSVSRF